ncbi:unnamed protein product [Rodentolepis nana]|uniref:Ras-GEF domain-containing protein n=1 Tax=Rodentolepis nana TaxID=102285 RepID=A0A0R3T4U4_RODNA|nr:unnamed protein product [Rodentolepis nana]
MSSEQTIREESSQSPSTDQGNVQSTVRMDEESGDNFVNLLPTLKRCVDGLCRTIEWITRVTGRNYLKDNARIQVISFLLDNGPLLNILGEVNPTVEGTCNRLRACIGHIGYLNRTLCAYDKFVAKLENGQRTIQSASSTLHAKKAFLIFCLKYVRAIQAIAPYHESARFAIRACRRLRREWIDNALNKGIRPEVLESLQYLINVKAALPMDLRKTGEHIKSNTPPEHMCSLALETINVYYPADQWLQVFTHGSYTENQTNVVAGIYSEHSSFYAEAGHKRSAFDGETEAVRIPTGRESKPLLGLDYVPDMIVWQYIFTDWEHTLISHAPYVPYRRKW